MIHLPRHDDQCRYPITNLRVAMSTVIQSRWFNDLHRWATTKQTFISHRVRRDAALQRDEYVRESDWEATLKPYAKTVTHLDLSRSMIYSRQLAGQGAARSG